LNVKLEDASSLISLVKYLMFHEKLSEIQAYQKALEIRANPENYRTRYDTKNEKTDFEDDDSDKGYAESESESYDDEEGRAFDESMREYISNLERVPMSKITDEQMNRFFHDFIVTQPDAPEFLDDDNLMDLLFQEFCHAYFSAENEARDESKDQGSDQVAPSSSYIKSRYRQLVRRLHPDYRDPLDEQLNELWHQVQDAYQAEDIERLEMLSASCDIFDGNVSDSLSVSQIKSVQEEYGKQTKFFRGAINRAKKSIEWGFRKQKDTRRIEKQIHSDLEFRLRQSNHRLSLFEDLIRSWKESSEKRDTRGKTEQMPAKGTGSKKRNHAPTADVAQPEFAFG